MPKLTVLAQIAELYVYIYILGSPESRCWYNLHHLLDLLVHLDSGEPNIYIVPLLGAENSQFRHNRASNV